MYGFYYLYRGPKQSLFARYGVALFVTNEVEETKYEPFIPGTGHLFDRRTDVNVVLHPHSKLFTHEIDYNSINSLGELDVKRTKKVLYGYGIAHAHQFYGQNLYIKDVSRPGPWYERLAVSAAVHSRRPYMMSLGKQWGIDMYSMERDLDAQIKYLLTLKLLPPQVDWNKTMNAFRDVYPKPAWWYQELRFYKLKTEGKLYGHYQ